MNDDNTPWVITTVLVLLLLFSYNEYSISEDENVELSITLQKTEHKLVEKTYEVKMLEEQIAELKGE